MTTFTISLPKGIAQQVATESKKRGFATNSEFIRALLSRYFTGKLTFEVFAKKPLAQIKKELTKTGKYNQKFIQSVTQGLRESSVYAK